MPGKILLILLYAVGAVAAGLLLYLLLLAVSVLFIDPKKDYDERSPYFVALSNSLAWMILLFSNVKVNVEGIEKIPGDGKFLLVSNHRSLYDPLTAIYHMRQFNLIFVSKPENFSIPIAGRLARRYCYRAIDRENARNALATVKDCVRLIENGVGPVFIYPEGTRSKTGKLLPFHNSVFKIAQDAKVPIVVMSTRGTEMIHKNAPWRTSHVTLRVLDVLPTDFVTSSRTAMIGEKVRSILSSDLQGTKPTEESVS